MNRKQFFLTLSVAIISGFLGGMLGVWFLMPSSVLAQDEPQKVIEAEEFRVVDREGKQRVTLNKERFSFQDEEGVPSFNLSSIPGKVELYMSRGDSSLDLFVNTSKSSIGLDDQTGSLDMTSIGIDAGDWAKNDAFSLTGGFLWLFNSESYEGIKLELDADKKPSLELHSTDFRAVAVLGPSLELYDSTGDLRAVLGSTELKNNRTGSTEIRAPSSLVLFDEEGKVVWSAP